MVLTLMIEGNPRNIQILRGRHNLAKHDKLSSADWLPRLPR